MIPSPKQNNTWSVRAVFEPGRAGLAREYLSRDVRFHDPSWGSEVFSRRIESIEFFLPTGHRILMRGMERYNFFVECSQSLGGGNGAIEAFWLCGLIPGTNQVEMWRVGNGRVLRKREAFGREWGGGPTSGWKQGLPGRLLSRIIES
jgi:hypothetical protein